jgi:hypothetical protein
MAITLAISPRAAQDLAMTHIPAFVTTLGLLVPTRAAT